ncbi:MAG TPA: hypothetical protein VJQ57_03500, partial [Acidimicrobiia bacterium]|nr:hypothetical protein [Acidimicrobiia bacterium]
RHGLRAAALLLVSGVLTSCADGPNKKAEAQPPAAIPAAADSEFSIKVFVEEGGTERLVHVAPLDWRAPSSAADLPSGPGQKTQALSDEGEQLGEIRQAATVQLPDGGVVDTDDDVVPGWTLLKWAAHSCETSDPVDFVMIGDPWVDPSLHPGAQDGLDPDSTWYIYHVDSPFLFGTCDSVVYREEMLLCTADRLAQVADSPGTVYWASRKYTTGPPTNGVRPTESIKITIPPQATKDKFIARDMALNVLGHLARMTVHPHEVRLNGGETASKTCGEWLADVANTGENQAHDVVSPLWYRAIFPHVTDYFDPVSIELEGVSSETLKEMARRRLDRSANVRVAAARLTRDLAIRTVTDDISGAHKAFASGGDKKASTLRAWGLEPGQEPYNSLRHAMKTIYGRLEAGPAPSSSRHWFAHAATLDDPMCNKSSTSAAMALGTGVEAKNLIENIGFGIDGRWSDIAPGTRGETLAVSFVS